MDLQAVVRAYDRYATIYDGVFNAFFSPGRHTVVSQVNRDAQTIPQVNVLEVGIGTGASLPLYTPGIPVTGIDISANMLAQAEKRVQKKGLNSVNLMQMNAEALSFSDNQFSHVMAMYIASVSPNPKKLISELIRVCQPGGRILLLNHFSKETGMLSYIERFLSPIAKSLGFHPYFPLNRILPDNLGLEIELIVPANLFGYWSIVQCKKPVQTKSSNSTEQLIA